MPFYRELKNPDQYNKKFQQGFNMFVQGDFSTALALFSDALHDAASDDQNKHKYLSYYGRILFNTGEQKAGLEKCLAAAEQESLHADVFYNLACVAHLSGKRELALKSLTKGRAIDPYDTQLLHMRHALGMRRKPVLARFSRKNILNILLGKVTYWWFKPAQGLN